MRKNILIINGHPDDGSFCSHLAKVYKKGSDSTDARCKLINLYDLNFNLNLSHGYRQRTELEPDLIRIQQDIIDSNHLVFVYPSWWSTYPAILKGFIDRVFLPKFAFGYRDDSLLVDKLLKGKSARLIVTTDTPKWYETLVYKSPGHNSLKKGILEFCGIRPVSITTFGPVKNSDDKKRQQWINKVVKLGKLQK